MVNEKLVHQRDTDLHVLHTVSNIIDSHAGMRFIVTGSYSIEALTGQVATHNDIDGNVFTHRLGEAWSVVRGLDCRRIGSLSLQLVQEKSDGLNFVLAPEIGQGSARDLEFRFIETVKPSQDDLQIFRLINRSGEELFEVPTETALLKDSHGREYWFRVKALSYAIATWAIRLSGVLPNQRRPVRDTDFEHFGILLRQQYQQDEVIRAIKYHPQMVDGISEIEVYNMALNASLLRS